MKTSHFVACLFPALLFAAVGSAQEAKPAGAPATNVIPAVRMQPAPRATPGAQMQGQSAKPQKPGTAVSGKPAPTAGTAAKPAPATLQTGATAPDFPSKDTAGKEIRLASLKDKVIVLDFWATWCGPCKVSLPHTQEVAKQYKDQGVVVLAVCTSDTRAKFEEFVKTNQDKYPDIAFTCDPNDRGSASFDDRASRKLYGVSGIPTQFVIGRDGKVAAVLVGYRKGETRLEDALAKLGLKAKPSTAPKSEG